MRPATRVALVLVPAQALGAADEDPLQRARRDGGDLDRGGKLDRLLRLSAQSTQR